MSTTTPGADQLQALISYSNNKTGASDTTLSDAVTRLVNGYGGGSYPFLQSYEQIEITEDLSSMTTQQFQNRFLPDLSNSPPYPTELIFIDNTIKTNNAAQAAVRLSSIDESYSSATGRYYIRGGGSIGVGGNYFHVGQGSIMHKFTFSG